MDVVFHIHIQTGGNAEQDVGAGGRATWGGQAGKSPFESHTPVRFL